MRLDSHQHFWRYRPETHGWIDGSMAVLKRDFLPPDLEPLLRSQGFDGCIAVQASQTLDDTRFLLSLAEHYPFIKGVVGWVDLLSPELPRQLEELARHPRFKGVRHVAQSEPDDAFLAREDVVRGIAALEAFGLAYDILIYARQLPAAIELARRLPRQRFVLDHVAKPEIKVGRISPWKEQVRELSSCPNVLCKVSGMVTEAAWHGFTAADFRPYLDVVWAAFGADRLMFGSDWPVCTLAADYATVAEIVLDALGGRPAAEREAVLGGNAARFYRIAGDGS
jgi:L-fucono-1,5-lactonase